MSGSDFWAKCPECGHVWSVVKLPMPIEEAARRMMAAFCPSCGNDSPTTASAAEIPNNQQELNMQSNDNAPIPPADPGLSPDTVAACDWACTIPGDVSLVQHPEFQKHFGHLSSEQVTLAGEEMRRRGEAAKREADLLEEEGRSRFGADFMTEDAPYEMRSKPFDDDMPDVIHTYAATPGGDYIGDEETAKYLCIERGIAPEKASPGHSVCSIGFCEKEQKWYGWSHRALSGFGIGSQVTKEDCGYVPVDMDDAVDAAVRFWSDEHHASTTAEKAIDEEGRPCIKVSWTYADTVPNEALRGTVGGTTAFPPDVYGRGEWTALTLDDAKRMAIDFAEAVS